MVAYRKAYYAANRDRLLAYHKDRYAALRVTKECSGCGVEMPWRRSLLCASCDPPPPPVINPPKPVITTRKIAALAGLRRYEGRPCKTCGLTTRATASAQCVSCRNRRKSEARKRIVELLRASPKPEKPSDSKRRKVPHRTAERIVYLQAGRCACCRKRLADFHVDHIVPLARGGTNDRRNMQVLCPSCNLDKGANDPIEFAQRQGRLL